MEFGDFKESQLQKLAAIVVLLQDVKAMNN
jgi:hypothetical protein